MNIIELQPDDVIVAFVPQHLDAEQRDHVTGALKSKFPKRDVLVLDGGITLTAVRSVVEEAAITKARRGITVPHVWLGTMDASRAQRVNALAVVDNHYAIAWDDLTEDQKAGRTPSMPILPPDSI